MSFGTNIQRTNALFLVILYFFSCSNCNTFMDGACVTALCVAYVQIQKMHTRPSKEYKHHSFATVYQHCCNPISVDKSGLEGFLQLSEWEVPFENSNCNSRFLTFHFHKPLVLVFRLLLLPEQFLLAYIAYFLNLIKRHPFLTGHSYPPHWMHYAQTPTQPALYQLHQY